MPKKLSYVIGIVLLPLCFFLIYFFLNNSFVEQHSGTMNFSGDFQMELGFVIEEEEWHEFEIRVTGEGFVVGVQLIDSDEAVMYRHVLKPAHLQFSLLPRVGENRLRLDFLSTVEGLESYLEKFDLQGTYFDDLLLFLEKEGSRETLSADFIFRVR